MPDNSAEHEAIGLHALGDPNVEYRTSEGGQSGTGPIGQRLPSGVMANGMPRGGIRSGMRGMPDGKESLSRKSSR